MLKNIVKSSLHTIDEITMKSVKENIAQFEKSGDQEEIEENPLTSEFQNVEAAETNIPSSETAEKKEDVDEGIFKKCVSKKGYDDYIKKVPQLISSSKHFNRLYQDAVGRLGPDSSLSKQGGERILKEVDEAYFQILAIRKRVISTFTLTEQENDKYCDKFFKKRQEIHTMFDAKFEEQFSSTSSIKSRKNSLHQSTAIVPNVKEENEELVEQERKKAEQAHREFVQAEQSLAAQREACQRQLAAFDEQHKRLLEGQSRPISPSPSVTSSCIAPFNASADFQENKIESMKEIRAQNLCFNCRFCEMRFASIEETDQHEQLIHVRPLPPQDSNQKSMVQSQASSQNLKTDEERTMMQQMAIDNFNPRRYVKKIFTGDDLANNYQNYSVFRGQWMKCVQKALNLGVPKADLYDHLVEVLDGSALEIVDTPTQDENTYEEALKRLDKNFLNPTLYLKEVTASLNSLEPMKDERISLMKGINTLEKGWANLKARKLSHEHLLTMYFCNLYEPKLSPKAMGIWTSKRTAAKDDKHPMGYDLSIEDFFAAVREAETHLQFSNPSGGAKKNEDKKKAVEPKKPVIFGSHSTGNQENSSNEEKKCPVPQCPQMKHKLMLKCPQLPKMKPQEVIDWAKKNGITCKMCLDSKDHKSKDCPGLASGSLQKCKIKLVEGPRVGQECNGPHCIFVHLDTFPRRGNRANQSHSTATPTPVSNSAPESSQDTASQQ